MRTNSLNLPKLGSKHTVLNTGLEYANYGLLLNLGFVRRMWIYSLDNYNT